MMKTICPSCFSEGLAIFHKVPQTPVHSVFNMPTRERAMDFPKGRIQLGFCPACGFISNVTFDPGLMSYSDNCEESQGFSPTFQAFLDQTVSGLVERYRLREKTVLEIGCGKGEFLAKICEAGNNRGIGFDPAFVEGRIEGAVMDRVQIVKDFFSTKYTGLKADIICCRMTLEHIADPGEFIRELRRFIGDNPDTVVFFQVPDVIRVLKECAFEDIYYEHCSYFSPGSLGRLFRENGFEILDLKVEYGSQYVMLEARPVDAPAPAGHSLEENLAAMGDYVSAFEQKYAALVSTWRKKVTEIKETGRKAVMWGSGSKGVSFLNCLNVTDEIQYVVDINPFRQGTYMAGTGQLIVAPAFLRGLDPDFVIVMNPIYVPEIVAELKGLGLAPEVMALGKGEAV